MALCITYQTIGPLKQTLIGVWFGEWGYNKGCAQPLKRQLRHAGRYWRWQMNLADSQSPSNCSAPALCNIANGCALIGLDRSRDKGSPRTTNNQSQRSVRRGRGCQSQCARGREGSAEIGEVPETETGQAGSDERGPVWYISQSESIASVDLFYIRADQTQETGKSPAGNWAPAWGPVSLFDGLPIRVRPA